MSSKQSLVVLQSDQSTPNRFRAVFDEPIEFPAAGEGPCTVELVNMSVFADRNLEIIAGVNDSLRFRIANSGAYQTAVVAPGIYENLDDFRAQLELAMNKVVNLEGSSWHCSIAESPTGDLDVWSLRIETSFKDTVVEFTDLLSKVSSVASSGVVTRDGSANGYLESFAASSQAFSRGRGYFKATLKEDPNNAGKVGATAFGVCKRQPTILDVPETIIHYGFRIDADTSGSASIYIIEDGTVTASPEFADINDVMEITRVNGVLTLKCGGVTIDSRAMTADDALLYPCVGISTKDCFVDTCSFIPDGDTTSNALKTTVGMRDPSEKPLLSGYSGTVDVSHPAYDQMHLGGRSTVTQVVSLDADKLQFILGMTTGILTTPNKVNSYTFKSTSTIIYGVDESGLEIQLANLPISSRNTSSRLTTKTIACIPRLESAGLSRRVYASPYPMPVSLLFRQRTAISELECAIRNSRGEPAQLSGTSCVTLRFVH